MSFSTVFDRTDVVLCAAAVAGLVLYVLALPAAHPDRAARDHAPQEQVVDSARAFLEMHAGRQAAALSMRARIRRDPELLDTLFETHGRADAIELIRKHGIPGYYWDIDLTEQAGDQVVGGREGNVQVGMQVDSEARNVASIRLTLDGRPYFLQLDEAEQTVYQLQKHILSELLAVNRAQIFVDSVSADRWIFRFSDPPGTQVFGTERRERAVGPDWFVERTMNESRDVRPFYLRPEARVLLNQYDAAALAQYHLRGSAFAGEIVVDSVKASGRDGRLTAVVHVSSSAATLGRPFSAEVEVAPTGALLRMEPRFIGPAVAGSPDLEDILEILQIAAYILLAVIAFVVFLRRVRHQLIDVGAAMRDGALAALAAGIALFGQVVAELTWSISFELFVLLIGFSMISLLAGLIVFFLSGAANSTARDIWGEKLQSLDLMRQVIVRNVPVGQSLVRGVLVGLVFVGLLSAGVSYLPSATIDLSHDPVFYTGLFPGSNFITGVMGRIFLTLLVGYLTMVGPAAFIRSKTSRVWIVGGAVVLALVLTQTSPVVLEPLPYTLALSTAVGILLAWTIWRFDVLTLLVAFFAGLLLWDAAPGWVVPHVPEWIDAVLALLFVGGLGLLGMVGVRSGRSVEDVPTLVPEYISELARRERLERELELARSMQLSFLPRRTPDVPGLDLASICVPAYEVGGDYYDFFRLGPSKLAFAVGDVSGKGMEAAFYMTLMKGILQSLVEDGAPPAMVLSRANTLFRKNVARNTFMSMSLCVVDVETRRLTLARAGHNPLIIRRSASGRVETHKPGGAALGLAYGELFDGSIREVSVPLERNDVVVVYTDGLTEAMNAHRELYGEDRLDIKVAESQGEAQDVLKYVLDDVAAFCGGAEAHDDMTLLVARIT